MTLSKKALAKLLFRIRVELIGRPQYDRYYQFIFEQRLPADSRAKRRARWKTIGYTIPFGLLLIEFTNFLVASQFSFAHFTANWPAPYAMATWLYHQSFTQTEDALVAAAISAINTRAFSFAATALAIDVALIVAFALTIYWTNRNDRWLLSTEKGAANWILPEKLAESGLLPPNYDIYAGFDASEYERIEHDAMLQRQQNERIAAYSAAYAEWEAQHNPDGNRSVITLPIYGTADAMFVNDATQTDTSAPWLQPKSTPTNAMPKEPSDITLPDFSPEPSAPRDRPSQSPGGAASTP